jgi:hypothetical protein
MLLNLFNVTPGVPYDFINALTATRHTACIYFLSSDLLPCCDLGVASIFAFKSLISWMDLSHTTIRCREACPWRITGERYSLSLILNYSDKKPNRTTPDDINKALEASKESWDEQTRTLHDSNRHSVVTGWKVNMEKLGLVQKAKLQKL